MQSTRISDLQAQKYYIVTSLTKLIVSNFLFRIMRRIHKRKKIFLLLPYLLLLPIKLSSQTFYIKGNISTITVPVEYALITFHDQNDWSTSHSTITDTAGNYWLNIVTDAEKEDPIIPQNLELEQNYPNPFSVETAISYKIHEPSHIRIIIYNVLGQKVRTFLIGEKVVGIHTIVWDGTNDMGDKVSSGIYFCQLQAGHEIRVRKMLLATTNMPLPLTGNLSANGLTFCKGETARLTSGLFTVQIANTDSTDPKIQFHELPNVDVQHDTVLNFQVQIKDTEQWRFLGLENEIVTAIAVDPLNPLIIYAGTKSDFSAGINGKLFKSMDGGVTWDTLLVGGSYKSILIDPLNHDIIYAMPFSLIKSEDGGQTWQSIIDGISLDWETRVQSLAMNPKNTKVLYAGTGGFYTGNLYKSSDGGLHWNKTPSDSLLDGVVSIAIDPVDTNNVYVGTQWRCIIWKSTDAGQTWLRTGSGERGGIIDVVAVNPKHNNIIYAGVRFEGLLASFDSGENWAKGELPDSINSCVDMEFNPSYPSDIYIATGNGIFNQTCENCSWEKLNNGISDNTFVNVLAFGKNYLYAGMSAIYGKKGGISVNIIEK